MIVTLKNLQQQSFTIEIDGEETVKALKERIETTKGSDYPADGQKLIYSGKILADEKQLKEYSIDENKFIVVMVAKPKPPASIVVPPPTPATVPTTATTAEAKPASTTTNPPTAATITTPTSESSGQPAVAATPPSGAGGGLSISGPEFERSVENIVAMGYDKAEVERALRASFNNPDRAVEYLLNGIPPELSQEEAVPNINAPSAAGGVGGVGGANESGGESGSLGFLRSQPQFEQMRQVVRENPQLLNAVLQQIGQTNPALLQVISENQEEFVRLLNEESPPSSSGSSTGSGPPASGGGGGGGFQIAVTPADKEAIERLKQLGFPEEMVVQAYFACEKNETLAANFLLSVDDD